MGGYEEQTTKFKIATKRKADAVEVRAEKDKTEFNVRRPFGVGQAVIGRVDENWPGAVVLRLHLGGRGTSGLRRVEPGKCLGEESP